MNLKTIRELIKDLLLNDIKLERTKSIGSFLTQFLKPYISKSLYDTLSIIDSLSLAKKKAILEQILEETSIPITNSTTNTKKHAKTSLKDLNIYINNMDFLNKKHKNILSSFGINTLIDVLWYYPYTYENRILIKNIMTLPINEYGAILLEIEKVVFNQNEKYPLTILSKDGFSQIALKFNIKDKHAIHWYTKGQKIVAYGKLKEFKGQRYMIHPKIFTENSNEINIIKPIYPLGRNQTEDISISANKKRKLLEEAINLILEHYKKLWQDIENILPDDFIKQHNLMSLSEALKIIHVKDDFKDFKSFENMLEKAKRYFLYEEIFIFELAMLRRQHQIKSLQAPRIVANVDDIIREIEKHTKFNLTNAQKKAIDEILQDMSYDKPMSRLLQGDVGSGKTAVAMACALACLKNNLQVALMVPTEILANQHFKNFKNFFSKLGFNVGLLTSSTSKTDIKKLISKGFINITIGTHALIQEDVIFKELGLVIIDEQHRFGVAQRQSLLEKNHNLLPHMLYMSATPIPRTIAMGIFGDMDISVLDEMPSNRKPVKTYVLYSDSQSDMNFLIHHIKQELSKKRKIYVVYPLIEESEKTNLKAAQSEYERWKNIFNDYKVLLLHGKMNDTQKSNVMEEFKDSGDILISTTVIEVGIDVPTASTIVIEDAYRFGLSQLHQLRGRVGRGNMEGYCFLTVSSDFIKNQKYTEQNETLRRLNIMVKTTNGFEISLEDLQMRGPGDVLGLSQSGYFQFNIANLKNKEHLQLMSSIRNEMPKYLKGITQNLEWILEKRYFENKDITIA